jgi:hypothetical protein
MASKLDTYQLDLEEQLVRIRRQAEESEKFSAETRKLLAESKAISLATVFQGFIAIAALMGAGVAIAKLFFPWHHGAHRRRQDDDDRAHPLLHRQVLQDRRSA